MRKYKDVVKKVVRNRHMYKTRFNFIKNEPEYDS